MNLAFTWVDVFADEQFGGNQLCVFHPAPADLAPEVMRRITRELNHAETVFVQPPATGAGEFRIRIWVPVRPLAEEIPFAGHPILGAACAVRPEGGIVRFETGRGVIPVEVRPVAKDTWAARMAQPLPAFEPFPVDPAWLESALGVNPGSLRRDLPIERADNGMRTLLVPFASQAAVDGARPDMRRLAELGGGVESCVLIFAAGEQAMRCRVFCPFDLNPEDAATGSANGPLGAYLVRHGAAAGPVVQSEQGHAIGRPSRLTVEVTPEAILVGGRVQYVGAGAFRLKKGAIQ